MTLSSLVKQAQKITIDNSPAILTGFAVVGTISVALVSGRAGYRIAQFNSHEDPHRSMLEKTRDVWRDLIPPAVMSGLTITAIVASNRISNNRVTALATAYALSEKAYSEYKDNVKKHLSKKKHDEVEAEVAQKRAIESPEKSSEVILGVGEHLCFDSLTGRYFKSTVENIRRAENTINKQILNDGYASLSDFYYEINLKRTSYSDEVGWNSDTLLEVVITSILADNGEPAISIGYRILPKDRFVGLH